MTKFTLNEEIIELDLNPEMPLLWVLRDQLGLTGTKFGCGGGFCGACTIHIEGQATRACQIPLGAIEGLNVRTIEAFGEDASHPVQKAWAEINVSQCGYCQPGQIMSAIALLEQNPHPGDAEIDQAMNGNLCRCGTYPRVKAAIKLAAV